LAPSKNFSAQKAPPKRIAEGRSVHFSDERPGGTLAGEIDEETITDLSALRLDNSMAKVPYKDLQTDNCETIDG